MTQQRLGKLTRVDAREVWRLEAEEFTPWLAENLALLNQALGLQIELTERERQVGAFAVDIFGKEVGSGAEVVIENQLAQTDHSHLGQLLTYAAGLDAKVVIWISPRFRDEHSQAIDWLNRHTPPEMSFFAVELELLRIDDSPPAPHFKIVAEPSEWQKEVSSEVKRGRRTEREIAYHAFFSALLARVNDLHPGFTSVKSVGYGNWLSFSTGRTGFNINVAIVKPDTLRVELYISTGNADKNRLALQQLREQTAEIEAGLPEPLVWDQMAKDCRIYVRYEAPVDPANPPEGALDWAAQRTIKFREVFAPRVTSLVLDPPEEPAP